MKILAKFIANHLPGGAWIARHLLPGGAAAAEEAALRRRIFSDYLKVSDGARKRLGESVPTGSKAVVEQAERTASQATYDRKFLGNQAVFARRISEAREPAAVFAVLSEMHPNFLETVVPDAAIARLGELKYVTPAAREADLAKVRQMVADRERKSFYDDLAFWQDIAPVRR